VRSLGAQVEADTQKTFDVVEIRPGVFAGLVVPSPPMYAFANSLIVIDEQGVLVVDTQQSPSAARALIAEIKDLTDLPVRWVVNTHWHGDHVYGNQSYREAFEVVEFVGHHETAQGVLEEGAAQLAEEIEEMPASIEARRTWMAEGKGPGGQVLTAEDSASLMRSLSLREAQLRELEGLTLIPPNVTFGRNLKIDFSNHRVELMYFGPAHTRGDAVVYLPDIKLLAVGDLLEEALPWLEGADVVGWADALDSLSGLDVEYLLPSHGGLQEGRGLLDLQRGFFRSLVDGVRMGIAEGLETDEIKARIELDEFILMQEGISQERFDRYVQSAVENVFGQLTMQGAS
ncbi:MAG: MBL fold metallo-hydrolase, partial [Gemmatimonadota bacterium]|nr:MBL fold metallo-hydrolase [Gemmatimonadota bacterium]